MAIKNLNGTQEILASKSANELEIIWAETEKRFRFVLNSTGLKNRDIELDAIIRVRGWLMKAMQEKMNDVEFCKVVGA